MSEAGNLCRNSHFFPMCLEIAQTHLQLYPTILELNGASIIRPKIINSMEMFSNLYNFLNLDARNVVNLLPHIAHAYDFTTKAIGNLEFGHSVSPDNHEGSQRNP